MLWRSASELGQKYATQNYPSQGTPICRLNTAPAQNLRKLVCQGVLSERGVCCVLRDEKRVAVSGASQDRVLRLYKNCFCEITPLLRPLQGSETSCVIEGWSHFDTSVVTAEKATTASIVTVSATYRRCDEVLRLRSDSGDEWPGSEEVAVRHAVVLEGQQGEGGAWDVARVKPRGTVLERTGQPNVKVHSWNRYACAQLDVCVLFVLMFRASWNASL